MKTKLKLFLVLFAIVVLMSTTIFATNVSNEENQDNQPVTTSENLEDDDYEGEIPQTQEDVKATDMFFAGDDVEVSQLIDGNVFVIGKNVKITGQTSADLFVIAENLTLEETALVYGSVFAVASEITINGQMNSVYATCDKLTVEYNGCIYRDLKVKGTEVSVNGIVKRNSYIESDKLNLDNDCIMGGDLIYTAQSQAVYKEKTEDGNINETETIPSTVLEGEAKYTKRDKKLFSKSIKKTVEKILKDNKINNDTSEEKIKSTILSYVFNTAGISSNSETVKGAPKCVMIPKMYVYIVVAVIVLLALALILPHVIGKKSDGKNPIGPDNK